MKSILLCLVLIASILASCGKSASAGDNPAGNTAPVETIAGSDTSSSSPTASPVPTYKETALPTPTPDKTNPDDFAYINESDILTKHEAIVLAARHFGLEPTGLYCPGADDTAGYLLKDRANGNGIVAYVDPYTGDVRNENKEIVFNLLEDQPANLIMSALDYNELAVKSESRVKTYLFRSVFGQIGKGTWYETDYIYLVRNGSCFNGGTDPVTFNYDNVGKQYYYLRTFGANAETGKFNRIVLTRNPDRYHLYDGDRDLGIIFDIGEGYLPRMNYRYQTGKGSGSTGIFADITDYGVPDMETFINNRLYGLYEDGEGRIYEFNGAKKALWPDRSFNYTPYDDNRWTGCNPLVVLDENGRKTGEYYGYLKTGGQLALYKTTYDQSSGYRADGQPFLVLKNYTVDQEAAPLGTADFNISYNGVTISDSLPLETLAATLGFETGKVDYTDTDIFVGSGDGDWYVVHYPSARDKMMQIDYVINKKLNTKYLVSVDLFSGSTSRGIKVGDGLKELLQAYGNCTPVYNSKTTDAYYYKLDRNAEATAPDKSICFVVDRNTNKIAEIAFNYNENRAAQELDLGE